MNIVFKNFINLSKNEHIELLKIRNTNHVRLNMKTKEIIKIDEHLSWILKLKNDNKNDYFVIIVNDKIVGAIYITEIDFVKNTSTWGLYFKENINPLISSLSTFIFMERIFNFYNISILKLEVNKLNNKAYKFDLNFGFQVYDEYKEGNDSYHLMSMHKNHWEHLQQKGLISLLQKKVNNIIYTFIKGKIC